MQAIISILIFLFLKRTLSNFQSARVRRRCAKLMCHTANVVPDMRLLRALHDYLVTALLPSGRKRRPDALEVPLDFAVGVAGRQTSEHRLLSLVNLLVGRCDYWLRHLHWGASSGRKRRGGNRVMDDGRRCYRRRDGLGVDLGQ